MLPSKTTSEAPFTSMAATSQPLVYSITNRDFQSKVSGNESFPTKDTEFYCTHPKSMSMRNDEKEEECKA